MLTPDQVNEYHSELVPNMSDAEPYVLQRMRVLMDKQNIRETEKLQEEMAGKDFTFAKELYAELDNIKDIDERRKAFVKADKEVYQDVILFIRLNKLRPLFTESPVVLVKLDTLKDLIRQAENMTAAFKMVSSNFECLHKIMHAVIETANFVNHRVDATNGIETSEKEQAEFAKKNFAMTDLKQFYETYCPDPEATTSHKTWFSSQRRSMLTYVTKWLMEGNELSDVDLQQLQGASKQLDEVLSSSFFGVMLNLNQLLFDYQDLERIQGCRPPIDPDCPVTVQDMDPAKVHGFADNFNAVLDAVVRTYGPDGVDISRQVNEAVYNLYQEALKTVIIYEGNSTWQRGTPDQKLQSWLEFAKDGTADTADMLQLQVGVRKTGEGQEEPIMRYVPKAERVLHEIKKCVDVCLSAVAQGEGGLFGGLETKEDVIPYAKRATRREAYMAGKGGASEFN